MASPQQIEANRRNAQKSTGPTTPEGRAAVRLNGIKHGLTAATLILPGEKESDFEALLDSLEAEHAPTTPTEELLVRQLAMATWRLTRFYRTEAAFYALRLNDLERDVKLDYPDQDLGPDGRLAYLAYRDACANNVLSNFARHEARLERSFYKALQELQRIRTLRQKEVTNRTQSDVGQVPDLPAPNTPFLVPDPPVPANPTGSRPPNSDSDSPAAQPDVAEPIRQGHLTTPGAKLIHYSGTEGV